MTMAGPSQGLRVPGMPFVKEGGRDGRSISAALFRYKILWIPWSYNTGPWIPWSYNTSLDQTTQARAMGNAIDLISLPVIIPSDLCGSCYLLPPVPGRTRVLDERGEWLRYLGPLSPPRSHCATRSPTDASSDHELGLSHDDHTCDWVFPGALDDLYCLIRGRTGNDEGI